MVKSTILSIFLLGCSGRNGKLECEINKNLIYKGFYINHPTQNIYSVLSFTEDNKLELTIECLLR